MEVDRMYVQRLINQIGVPITDGGGGSDVCWKAQYQDMPVIQVFIFAIIQQMWQYLQLYLIRFLSNPT